MKKALICGGGGFIGNHLTKRLKKEGYWVRAVDIKELEYSKTVADEFKILDLREAKNCAKALEGDFDEVYQLAADRGGAGYMETGACEMMKNNILINVYMITEAVKLRKLPKYFFSSSVCVYRDMEVGSGEISEDDVYPAMPDNEYGWEKLYTEIMLMTYGKKYGMETRIARFHTTFGPEANWEGGREKAPDAISRKVAMAEEGGEVEVWGDGTSVRCFTYVDDLVEGIRKLMESNIDTPTNIGTSQYVTVEELVKTIIDISGKNLKIKYVTGAVGVKARNFSNKKIRSAGWEPKFSLRQGLEVHYPWVAEQVKKKYGVR